MTEYLTRQSPSWRNWFLNKLGVTDLPIPVTCWYCNQKAYLLPGSKFTEHLWHCNLCENTNAIDDSGDIMDAPPRLDAGTYSAYGSSLAQRTNSAQSVSHTKPSTERTLCDSCQRNQTLIYQIMSNYIRDENDPDSEYYEKTADEYQQSLHNKYPLCDVCQKKIQVIVAEQRGNFRRRRINEQRQRSLQSKTPTRLTSFQHQVRGSLWFILHGSILFWCVFAVWHPPQSPAHDMTMVTDINKWILQISDSISAIFHSMDDDQHTVISLTSPSSTLTNRSHLLLTLYVALVNIVWYIVNDFYNMVIFTGHAIYLSLSPSIYTTLLPENQSYTWNVANIGIIWYLFFYSISFLFMDWHIRASRTFLELSKPRRLQTYKLVQRFLYFYRFFILYGLAFVNSLDNTSLYLTFALSYFLLLTWSVLIVQLKKSKSNEWPEKIVGKSDRTQQHQPEPMQPNRPPSSPSQSILQESLLRQPSISRTMTPNHQHLEVKESKPAWYHPLNFMFKQQPSDPQDAEVDGLTAELGRISV